MSLELDPTRVIAEAFTGGRIIDPSQFLFDDEEDIIPEPDDNEFDFWSDTDWWTGLKPFRVEDATTSTRREQVQAEETFKQTTPGSAASFQAAQAATMPVRWKATQTNGRIPLNKMTKTKHFGFLRTDAAESVEAMRRAAKRDGIELSGWGYRSYEEQEALLHKREQGIPVADPGHSEHGWAMAVDFSGLSSTANPGYQWLMKNGKKFGWHNPDWAQNGVEPWHWEFTSWKGAKVNAEGKPRRATRVKPAARPVKQVGGADIVHRAPIAHPASLEAALLSLSEQEPETIKRKGQRDVEMRSPKLKDVPRQYRVFFKEAAKEYGIPLGLLVEVARLESGFNREAVSSAGAQGIMQIMPLHGLKNPFNARQNILKGAEILASYVNGMGSLRGGLAAYNGGMGNPQYDYADRVLQAWRG